MLQLLKFRLREFVPQRSKGKVIKREMLFIGDIRFELIRKSMRTMSIRILPPNGEVRVSAPLKAGISDIMSFVESKANWIRKHSERMKNIPRTNPIRYVDGDKIKILGREFTLKLIDSGKTNVVIAGDEIRLSVPKGSGVMKRKEALERFYRAKLAGTIPVIIKKWEDIMNVSVKEFGIKKMKTRWGTCNIRDSRIWINLQLATTSYDCLEMIVVHEMTHLLERNHSKRFYMLMDRFLPDWPERKKELDSITHMLVD